MHTYIPAEYTLHAHGIDKATIDAVQALIDKDTGDAAGCNLLWQDIKSILLAKGLAKECVLTHPRDCVFDFANRSGLGGNAHDAHRNADQALESGADLQELT